jgi:HEAT repeat protein
MTGTLMARLFAAPLLIVSFIVGCAVVVVLLFGSIATDQELTIEELLAKLEGSTGAKTVGVLLPGEKELWQVSRELALRLRKKDVELTEEQVAAIAVGLSGQLDREISRLDRLLEAGQLSDSEAQKAHFVMKALALTEAEEAVGQIATLVGHRHVATRREALIALTELREAPNIEMALPEVIGALSDEDPIIRTVACVAISSVARKGDGEAIEALTDAYLDENREVQWNSALALARLGSDQGRSLLLDMLDRGYWEDVKVRIDTPSGETREYAMPAATIDRYLVATVEAVGGLVDVAIREAIEKLERDSSVEVREAVRKAMDSWGGAVGASGGV